MEKLPMAIFKELKQNILKSVWRHKRPQRDKAISRLKKNGTGGSGSLNSDYPTKRPSSKTYGAGTKTDHGTGQEAQKQTHRPTAN